MSSSSVNHFGGDDDRVQAVMFAVGLVVGSGITVCLMRRNVQRLEEYVELLRREVRRLKIAVDDHLALFDDGVVQGSVYNNNSQASSLNPAASSHPRHPPEADIRSGGSAPPPPPPTMHAPLTPRSSQSPPRRQTSKSTARPPCNHPPNSPASNSDGRGEEYFSARRRSDNLNVQSVSRDDDTTHGESRRYATAPAAAAAGTSSSTASNRDADLSRVFYQVDQLMDGSDHDKQMAHNILVNKSKNRQVLQNADFLWRLAKASYFMSQLESKKNKMKQKSLVYKAKDFAARALQIDSRNSDAHKWWAITLGSIGEYEGTTTKIQNGFEFKKHIDMSIELNPLDASSHHLLGRWCYRVYMLPWIERKVAAALFSTPPTATIDDALKHFLQSERINPDRWKENQLYIAKCFVEKKDYRKAVVWLEKASRIPVKNHSDEECQREVNNLLTQYRGYRM